MRNRWLDADLGRWLSRDSASYVDGMNLYQYVSGNPFKYYGPFGMEKTQVGQFLDWWYLNVTLPVIEAVGLDNTIVGNAAQSVAVNTNGFTESVANGAVSAIASAGSRFDRAASRTYSFDVPGVIGNVFSDSISDTVDAVDARSRALDQDGDVTFGETSLSAAEVLTGVGGVVDAITGVDPLSGEVLSGGERASRAALGVGQAAGLAAGAAAAARRALGPITRPTASPLPGNVSVHQSLGANGQPQYVGITNNLPRRAGEHLRNSGIKIRPIDGLPPMARSDALGVEQALINQHCLRKNGGLLLNRNNSISPRNPVYNRAVRRGEDFLSRFCHNKIR